jgi:TusA-related sulfurtransferase
MQDEGYRIRNKKFQQTSCIWYPVMTDDIKIDIRLDIKGQVCPYTFVRSKLAMEKMKLGEVLEIITDHRPALKNIPRSMEHEGQKVLTIEQTAEKEWRIFVRKDREHKRQ